MTRRWTEQEFKQEYKRVRDRIVKAVDNVGRTGRYILGAEVDRFERRFACVVGTKYCVGVGSGFGAILSSLLAWNITGLEVAIVNQRHRSAHNAVVLAKGTPVHVNTWRDAVKCPVILPVWPVKHIESGEICVKPIIEDACQGLGLRYKNQNAGTFGVMSCFSFHPLKPLHCFGDGGAVCTDSPEYNKRLREIRAHGRSKQSISYFAGINSRLDEVQAAILNVMLDEYLKQKGGDTQ